MKHKNIEQLCEDILNENFIQSFYSIHFVQGILGTLRVNIKHKFVTGPSRIYQCYSFLLPFLSIMCMTDMLLNHSTIFAPSAMDNVYKWGYFSNIVNNAMVAWQNNFKNGHLNSQLYVKLQNIDRKISFPGSQHINLKLTERGLLVTVLTTIAGIIWIFTSSFFPMQEFHLAATVGQMYGLGIYTNLILFTYIMYFIGLKLAYINNLLENKPMSDKFRILNKSIFTISERQLSDGSVSSELVVGVHSILEVLNDLLTLYQLPVSGSKLRAKR